MQVKKDKHKNLVIKQEYNTNNQKNKNEIK